MVMGRALAPAQARAAIFHLRLAASRCSEAAYSSALAVFGPATFERLLSTA